MLDKTTRSNYSPFWDKVPEVKKPLFIAFLFALFGGAEGQCNNTLDFPYVLLKAAKQVGNCLSLDFPTAQANVSAAVILSFSVKLQNNVSRFLNESGVSLSTFKDCCLEQLYELYERFANNDAMLWVSKNAIDLGYKLDPDVLKQLAEDLPKNSANPAASFTGLWILLAVTVICCALSGAAYYAKRSRYANRAERTPIIQDVTDDGMSSTL